MLKVKNEKEVNGIKIISYEPVMFKQSVRIIMIDYYSPENGRKLAGCFCSKCGNYYEITDRKEEEVAFDKDILDKEHLHYRKEFLFENGKIVENDYVRYSTKKEETEEIEDEYLPFNESDDVPVQKIYTYYSYKEEIQCPVCGTLEGKICQCSYSDNRFNVECYKIRAGVSMYEGIKPDGTRIVGIQNIYEHGIANMKAKKIIRKFFRENLSLNLDKKTCFKTDLKPIGRKKKGANPVNLTNDININFTFSEDDMLADYFKQSGDQDLYDGFQKDVVAFFAEKLGQPMPEIKITEKNYISIIHNMNRFPAFISDTLFGTISHSIRYPYDENRYKYRKDMSDVKGKTILEVIEQSPYPLTKKLKKLLIKNPSLLFILKRLKKMKVEDINIVYQIFSDDILGNEAKAVNLFKAIAKMSNAKDFYNEMTKIRGEKQTIKNLIQFSFNNNYQYKLEDTINMYHQILDLEKNMDEEENYEMIPMIARNGKPIFKLSIGEIHDELSIIRAKFRNRNRTIHYDDKIVQKLSCDDGSLHIRFPKDTHEVVNIGQKMRICVGSYCDRIIKQETVVMCLYDDRDMNTGYVGCFELGKDFKRIRQIKGVANHWLQGEYASFVKKWIENTKLMPDTIDYDMMIENLNNQSSDIPLLQQAI